MLQAVSQMLKIGIGLEGFNSSGLRSMHLPHELNTSQCVDDVPGSFLQVWSHERDKVDLKALFSVALI